MLRFLQLDPSLTVILLARRVTVMMAGRQLRMRMINLLEILTRWLRKIWTDLVTVLSYLVGLNHQR